MGGGSVQLLLYEKNVPLQWISVASGGIYTSLGEKDMVIHRRIEYTTIRVPCGSKRVPCPMEKGLVTIMNQKPALVILAAGMGSRFGGLKQLTPVGPGGEMIIDYSIHDAIRAGFGKIVFVIKHEIEEEFKEKIGRRTEAKIRFHTCIRSSTGCPRDIPFPRGGSSPGEPATPSSAAGAWWMGPSW